MILKKLTIKNIRSYKDAVVEFPEGSTLLLGDIGSGKTSILLAIEFALFGLQPGQKGNSLLRNNETEASVSLEFEVDGERVFIQRELERSGKSKSISQENTFIEYHGEKIEGSVTEIKNKILSILNYPQEFAKKTNDLYKFTVYTPQEEMKQIVLESNETRLNTLRHVFGIDKYKRIEENLDIFTSKLRQEVRVKEASLGNVELKNQTLNEKKMLVFQEEEKKIIIEKEANDVANLRIEKQKEIELLMNKINEKNKLENEKDKSELTLGNKKDTLSMYEREARMLKEQIKNAGSFNFNEKDIDILKNRIKPQEEILKDLNKIYIQAITSIQAETSRTNELKILRDKISSFEKCPTCLQIVNEEHKKNIVSKAEKELLQIQEFIDKSVKEEKETNTKIDQTKRLIDNLKQSLSQLEILKVRLESIKEKEKRIKEIDSQREKIMLDVEMINKHISGIDEILRGFKVYEEEYERKNKELRDIIIRENQVLVKKAEINKEIQFLQKQILDLEKEIKMIQETQKKLNYMKELEFWLNNKFVELVLFTEKNVMLKLREDFSKLFSSWFSILVTDTLTVKLDESFSPVIQQNDYDIDYDYLSGGERTAVALAYRLALNQTINSILSKIKTRDLVILDEPTDGFSESQLDKMRDVFQQLKVKQLILVSHEQKIEGFVDNIVRFRKEDGVTRIEK
jgi:exonuclease SbcC